MSYTVVVDQGKIYIKGWDKEAKKEFLREKKSQTLSSALQFPIEIKDATFGQFFELIERESELFERIFESAMYGHPIAPYIKEIHQPVPLRDKEDELQYMEVYWGADLFENELELFPSFHGWGKWSLEGGPPEGGIAIEFTPLNDYKDKPLKLDTSVEVEEAQGQNQGFKTVLAARMGFTVYDVIRAILYEITWAGDISKGREEQERRVLG